MPVAVEQKLFIPMDHHHHNHHHAEMPQHLDYSYGSGSDSEEGSSGGKEGSKRSATIKSAPPGTIQWLKDCYELCDNNSVPRCSVYNHYASYCSSTGVTPINAASFGKVIRSVFPNLKTRRLGTRGNSKYHYLGLKLKNDSIKTFEQANLSDTAYNKPYQELSPPMKSKKAKKTEEPSAPIAPLAPNVVLPDFTIPDSWSSIHDFPVEDARHFFEQYKVHCQHLIDYCYHHQFAEVEKLFKQFWTQTAPRLMGLMNWGEVIDLIIDKDHLTYKSIAGVLLPNVLQALPVSMSQTIRHFAEHLEQSLAGALINAPPNLAVVKLIVARKFAQSLNKQAALNHLTQAARAVLQNSSQIQAMILDWSKLDFDFIKEQASWVCQCPDEFVLAVMEGFKKHLTERASLETWAGWLQEIVFKILGKIHDSQSLLYMSQQMLLKWSFYSTLVMRDLTIRNAQSFGSFHLLRTLFDEYIFYIIESKFAFVAPPPPFYETPSMNHMVANNSSSMNNNNHYPQAPQPEPASHPSNPPGSLGGERPSISIPSEYTGYTNSSFDLGRPSISLETLLAQPGTLSFLRDRSNSLFGRGSFVFSGNLVQPQTPTQSSNPPTNNNNTSQQQQQDSHHHQQQHQQHQPTAEGDPAYYEQLAARFRSDDFTRSRNSLPRASISNLLSNPNEPSASGSTTPTSEILRQFGYLNGFMGSSTFPSGSFSLEPRNSQFDLYSLANSRPSINPPESSNEQKRPSIMHQEPSGQSNQSSSS